MIMIILAFIVMLPFYYVFIGIGEYVAHVYVLHNKYHIHWTRHHGQSVDHPLWLYTDLPVYWHLLVVTVTGILPLQIYRIYNGSTWAIGSMLSLLTLLCIHSYVWSKMHRSFHKIEHNWTERLKCYNKFYEHHILHHEHPDKNFGVLYIWTDKLFGTRKD